LAVVSRGSADERADGALAGRVLDADNPLSTARVYAYQTSSLRLHKVFTDRDGVFLFENLPAGLYKIIALKPGFAPAVVMLTRATAEATQFLEVEMSQEPSDPREAEASFWRIREQIPGDVLRDLDQPTLIADSAAVDDRSGVSLHTEMRAVAGVHESIDAGSAQVNGAHVGIEGEIRNVSIDFDGQFSELESGSIENSNRPSGSSQALFLEVEPSERASVKVASHSNNLVTFVGDKSASVDYERHRVSWSQAVGRKGQSDFSAQYTSENNYYRQALIRPNWMPSASRSWQLEGSYSTALGARSNLQAGLRYHDRESEYSRIRSGQPMLAQESVELFGQGDVAVNSTFVVQYGLYSAMRDGGLSLAPQGGLIVKLGPNWQASTLASKRLEQQQDDLPMTEFTPNYFEDGRNCREDALYCYELEFARGLGKEDSLSIGAVHRKIGETQRLYFDGDFLDRFDSLYLVEGDQLPELRLELTRRLTPDIVTTVSSNVGAGGGGLIQTGGRKTYENEVRYIVTSIDTLFEETDTGIYLAFHRLEQELSPVKGNRASPALELERLRLGLRQDLSILQHVATNLALHLNMEFSRGASTDSSVLELDDLRKRVTGGVAVRF
jgi:hypothetical protein